MLQFSTSAPNTSEPNLIKYIHICRIHTYMHFTYILPQHINSKRFPQPTLTNIEVNTTKSKQKKTLELNESINQMKLAYFYRKFHPCNKNSLSGDMQDIRQYHPHHLLHSWQFILEDQTYTQLLLYGLVRIYSDFCKSMGS